MTPEITFDQTSVRLNLRDGEHPELVRATLPQITAAITNWHYIADTQSALGNLTQAAEAEMEALKLLQRLIPPNVLRRITTLSKRGKPTNLRVLGVVVPFEEHKQDRIYYAWVTKDQFLHQKSAEGLAKTIDFLPSSQVIDFIDAYLAWLGNAEFIGQNGQVELAVRYPNKSVDILVLAQRADQSVHLTITADKIKVDRHGTRLISHNPIFWLKRAKVGLFDITKQKSRRQEGLFYRDSQEFSDTPSNIPAQQQLRITIRPDDVRKQGIITSASINDVIDGIDQIYQLNPPSTGQICNLLARLTHPRDFEPDLAERLRQEGIDLVVNCLKNLQVNRYGN